MTYSSEDRIVKLRQNVKNFREYGIEAAGKILGELSDKVKKLDAAVGKEDVKAEEIQPIVNSIGPSLESFQTVLRMARHYERQIWNLVHLGS